MYKDFNCFAKDMNERFDIPIDRALEDIDSVLSDGYSLDRAVDGLVAVYEREFTAKQSGSAE